MFGFLFPCTEYKARMQHERPRRLCAGAFSAIPHIMRLLTVQILESNAELRCSIARTYHHTFRVDGALPSPPPGGGTQASIHNPPQKVSQPTQEGLSENNQNYADIRRVQMWAYTPPRISGVVTSGFEDDTGTQASDADSS